MDLPPGQVDQVPGLADTTAAADLDAIEGDVQLVSVEDGVSDTDGGQHTPPVGVSTEDRTFEQVAARHLTPHHLGVPHGGGANHLDCDFMVRALGVSDQLTGQVLADPDRARR